MYPRAAIGTSRSAMCCSHFDGKLLKSRTAARWRASQPRVVARARNLLYCTQDGDGEVVLLRVDELEAYELSFAKKVAAFFNMSRSI